MKEIIFISKAFPRPGKMDALTLENGLMMKQASKLLKFVCTHSNVITTPLPRYACMYFKTQTERIKLML